MYRASAALLAEYEACARACAVVPPVHVAVPQVLLASESTKPALPAIPVDVVDDSNQVEGGESMQLEESFSSVFTISPREAVQTVQIKQTVPGAVADITDPSISEVCDAIDVIDSFEGSSNTDGRSDHSAAVPCPSPSPACLMRANSFDGWCRELFGLSSASSSQSVACS